MGGARDPARLIRIGLVLVSNVSGVEGFLGHKRTVRGEVPTCRVLTVQLGRKRVHSGKFIVKVRVR